MPRYKKKEKQPPQKDSGLPNLHIPKPSAHSSAFCSTKGYAENIQYIAKLVAYMRAYIQESVPNNGVALERTYHFPNMMPVWNIGRCGLHITRGYTGTDKRTLELFATFPDGSGRKMSIFWYTGSTQELLYFLTHQREQEIFDQMHQFSEEIANHD